MSHQRSEGVLPRPQMQLRDSLKESTVQQSELLTRADSGKQRRSGKGGPGFKHPLVIPKNSIYSGRNSRKDLPQIADGDFGTPRRQLEEASKALLS